MDGDKYLTLIENAEKEKSAAGKCKWIISMFKILATNDLKELHDGIAETKQMMTDHNEEAQKRTRKIIWLGTILLLVILTQNPALLGFISKLWFLIF